MSLEQNLDLGTRAMAFVHDRLPLGAANRPRTRQRARPALKSIRQMTRFFWKNGSTLVEQKTLANLAIRSRGGNCQEQSAVALMYLIVAGYAGPLEIFGLDRFERQGRDGDHFFIVMGRNPRSKIAAVRSWGDAAVVCDPWNSEVYAASEREMLLRMPVDRVGFDPTTLKVMYRHVAVAG
jgi:hypothetical protein